ncbi:MAG: hypothetical protein A3F74_10925 [Betaproteobacteria bacterium RIFCSPLOWO2_12_FULL_62_58]|nr:MAG: hypothetical protein A3F74_10925 [Betaproteobacteria bacterium RIFCSPLOWO2_12_FULL_62_58]
MEWITFLEYDFYCGVMRKPKLTPERLELKININKRFIRCIEPSAQPRGDATAHAERFDVDEASECEPTVIVYDLCARRGDQDDDRRC